MIAIDLQMDITNIPDTPAYVVEKVKYDPGKNKFSNPLDGLSFRRSGFSLFENTALKGVSDYGTSILEDAIEGLIDSRAIGDSETTVTLHKLIWGKLPRLDNYIDIDSLDDAEGIEKAFLEATKSQGW